MKTSIIPSKNFLITSVKFFLAVFCVFLLGCSSDNNRLLTDLEGIVEGPSGCNNIVNVNVEGIGIVAAAVPPEFGAKDTRIRFDMQLDQEILKDLFCNANVLPPTEIYRFTNVSLITSVSQ